MGLWENVRGPLLQWECLLTELIFSFFVFDLLMLQAVVHGVQSHGQFPPQCTLMMGCEWNKRTKQHRSHFSGSDIYSGTAEQGIAAPSGSKEMACGSFLHALSPFTQAKLGRVNSFFQHCCVDSLTCVCALHYAILQNSFLVWLCVPSQLLPLDIFREKG